MVSIKQALWLLRQKKTYKDDFKSFKGHQMISAMKTYDIDGQTYWRSSQDLVFSATEKTGNGIFKVAGRMEYEEHQLMSSSVIIDGVITLMTDPGQLNNWTPQGKNSFKLGDDITVGPTELFFKGKPFKLSFMQRLRYIGAYSALQEYHVVKEFRDSVKLLMTE